MAQTIDVTGLPKHSIRVIESLVEILRQRSVNESLSKPEMDVSEFERALDEVSHGLPALPTLNGLSRADIYCDHD